MFQEGNQSLGKHAFQISNSGCQGCSVCPQGCSAGPLCGQLSLATFSLMFCTNSRGDPLLPFSTWIPFQTLCMEFLGLLEVEMLIVKPVERAGRQTKTLGQVRPNSVGCLCLPLNIHQHVSFPQQRS